MSPLGYLTMATAGALVSALYVGSLFWGAIGSINAALKARREMSR